MAFPVILVNATGGTSNASGATASGAGPATALTGSAGVTADNGSGADARRIELDGSPDLTNVATDGSHALYFHDTTSGRRRYVAIEGKGNSGSPTAYVDVVTAMGGGSNGVSCAWAIGGKLSGIGIAAHKLLVEQASSAAGDMLPGWVIEMQSGHAETITASWDHRRAGDTTDGPVTLRGESGASVKPVLTFSNNGNAIIMRGNYQHYLDFDLRNSHGTKTASVAIQTGSSGSFNVLSNLGIGDSTNYFWKGIIDAVGIGRIDRCAVCYCASVGVTLSNNGGNRIRLCRIHNNGAQGVLLTGNPFGNQWVDNLIYANASEGIRDQNGGASGAATYLIKGNAIWDNGGDGIFLTSSVRATGGLGIFANIIGLNGGYGINFNGVSAAWIAAHGAIVRNNGFGSGSYANTSGKVSPSGVDEETIDLSAEPFDYSNENFNINNDAGGGASLRAATLTLPG